MAQNPAAPARSRFARYPALRTPAALRRRPRHARRRFRAAHLVVVTDFLHMRPRRDGRELSCREKDGGRRTKFGREGAGTFQCPRPLYIGRNLTYPSRGTFQCRGVGPWKAPRHEPASRGDLARAGLRQVQLGRHSLAQKPRDNEALPCLDPRVLLGAVWKSNLRRVRPESPRRPPRHRRDACSIAWRCRFLAARRSQHGSVIAEK